MGERKGRKGRVGERERESISACTHACTNIFSRSRSRAWPVV